MLAKAAAQPPKLRYRPVVYTPLSFDTPGSCNSIFSITLDHDVYKKVSITMIITCMTIEVKFPNDIPVLLQLESEKVHEATLS